MAVFQTADGSFLVKSLANSKCLYLRPHWHDWAEVEPINTPASAADWLFKAMLLTAAVTSLRKCSFWSLQSHSSGCQTPVFFFSSLVFFFFYPAEGSFSRLLSRGEAAKSWINRAMLFCWQLFSATIFFNTRSFVRWNWPDTHISQVSHGLQMIFTPESPSVSTLIQ